jgi:hypothetical protein
MKHALSFALGEGSRDWHYPWDVSTVGSVSFVCRKLSLNLIRCSNGHISSSAPQHTAKWMCSMCCRLSRAHMEGRV